MRHIAKEGRCFVSGCCMILKKENVLEKFPEDVAGHYTRSDAFKLTTI